MDDEEFRTSLSAAMGDGVKRITRLANQMMFLARGKTDFGDQIPMKELIGEAFRDAYVYQTGKPPELRGGRRRRRMLTVAGDHKALRHAFSEVMLNALQANPKSPEEVAVQCCAGRGTGPARGKYRDSRQGGRLHGGNGETRLRALLLHPERRAWGWASP